MIRNSLSRIRERIEIACEKAGRNPSDVLLITVSKTRDIPDIREAIEAEQTHFGENKAQELRDKYAELGDSVIWHFIGSLQSNKVKYVVPAATFIHSVDSLKLAQEIAKQAELKQKKMNCLIEFKTSSEISKAGTANRDEVFRIAEFMNSSPVIDLCGLMTIAPFVQEIEILRKSFSDLAALRDEMQRSGFALPHLSMGMTDDFELAIEQGATMIRIGSAIFGNRNSV